MAERRQVGTADCVECPETGLKVWYYERRKQAYIRCPSCGTEVTFSRPKTREKFNLDPERIDDDDGPRDDTEPGFFGWLFGE